MGGGWCNYAANHHYTVMQLYTHCKALQAASALQYANLCSYGPQYMYIAKECTSTLLSSITPPIVSVIVHSNKHMTCVTPVFAVAHEQKQHMAWQAPCPWAARSVSQRCIPSLAACFNRLPSQPTVLI
jgi:hypothetical protein